MKIMLAPMEGVVDYAMRQLLTAIGGFDRCVTEFVRVTDVLLPERVFFRYCPELRHGCRTDSGVPVHVQLLGSDPDALARNAQRATALGALGVDLNFGCPAKTVNRSQGGSVLLREPARVAGIVRAVRDSVPADIPVTAKIRLGYDSREFVADISGGIAEAGADELCVHARTRSDGYKPPAYWHLVRAVTDIVDIPVVINGEIWAVNDAVAARQQSGCSHVMLGRGALSCPDLAVQIRSADVGGRNDDETSPMLWSDVVVEVERQFERSQKISARHVGNRTKQWLAYLRRQYPAAAVLFEQIRRLHDEHAIRREISQHRLWTSRNAN